MTPKSASIVSLQSPKDISIGEVEAELSKIWQGYSSTTDGGASAATRAATFSLVVYEPEETQQLLAVLGFYTGPIDGIMGPRMRAALRSAQETYGLKVDGRANSEILVKLREEFNHKQEAAEQGGESIAPQYALDVRGSGIADAIASQNPCRVIALCPVTGEDKGVTAQVSAYCPLQKQSSNTLICCEYITLRGTAEALERVSSLVGSLLISELPKFVWWKTTPDQNQKLFDHLAASSNSVIVDSSRFIQPETDILKLHSLVEQGTNIADLNWRRLAAWQELTAEAFDPPERRIALKEVDRVTVDYESGNSAQAFMFLGWLASRLNWQPVSLQKEGGIYDLQRVKFVGHEQREVEAELAALPTADSGEIVGDMIDLRLNSTNLDANCCTVLCSETAGCMRMETRGGAQSCQIQQVTHLADQQAESLLSQQLQRWDHDLLYEESLAVTAQILQAGNSATQD